MAAIATAYEDAKIAHTRRIMQEAKAKARHNGHNEHTHLRVARNALDRVVRTGDYAFGVRLFTNLEKEFSEIRDELEEMREMVENLQQSARK